MKSVFPDKDFCLYVDYPFKRLVLLVKLCAFEDRLRSIKTDFSCTYLWLESIEY